VLQCSSPPHHRACYGVLRFVMESGAKGCEVIVSGKLRAQRAKSMKFKDGYMVSSGDPTRVYLDTAVRHVLLRQGVLGIKVRSSSSSSSSRRGGQRLPAIQTASIHGQQQKQQPAVKNRSNGNCWQAVQAASGDSTVCA
jgi:small subunit ribosomal protein S3e